MKTTIIAVGNGGYNLASDIIKANIFPDYKLIVCDTEEKSLERNKANADVIFLLEKLRGRVKASQADLVEEILAGIAFTLHHSNHFITLTAKGSGMDRMKNAVASLSNMFAIDERVENMSLIIRANEREIKPPLCLEEMSLISDYVGQLPESVNLIWAMYNDEVLDSNTVELSVIASGKKLKI